VECYKACLVAKAFGQEYGMTKSTSSSYPILVSFPIFRKNFMKNIKKPPTADALYLDEGVENE
jgi:arginine/lysine/ornithine decarboxylase